MRPRRRSQVANKAWESSGKAPGSGCPAVRANVVQHQIHQPRFKFPAAAFGRFFDGAAQFGAGHLADIFLLGSHGLAQKWILGAVGIKIGAQGDHDGCFHRLIAGRWTSNFSINAERWFSSRHRVNVSSN